MHEKPIDPDGKTQPLRGAILNLREDASLPMIEKMTEQERMAEFCRLLGKAVFLSRTLSDAPARPPSPFLKEPSQLVSDETERLIMDNLRRFGPTAPRDLGQALSVPRATLNRKLARLRALGLVFATGRTKGAKYHIATRASR